MKVLILIALLITTGYVSAGPVEQVISVQHDSQRGVTCWIVNNTGISCLPDSSLPQTAESTREAGRASPASTEHETGRLQPVSLPQEERFAL